MSKTINVGQPLFNNIEGHPFVLGPQGPYRTKEEAIQALIQFYETRDDIPNGQECIIAGVKFIWRGNDLYESLAVKTINESQSDLNFYRTPGTYRFNSIRNNNFTNLPINNNNPNASITGELVVYSSVEGTTTYRSIIGQVLFLSNAEGHETKIYTRSANKTSKDGGATYEVTWGDWQVCQGMKEVGLVGSYDSFIDNGMYSGIYNNNSIIETFVIITVNDYIVKSQFNQPKSVSQLKYALNAITNKSELSIRVGGGEPFAWGEWKPIFDAESITTKITNLQNQLNALTEGTTGNINEIVNKAVNNIVGGAPEAYDTLKEIVDYVNQNKDEVTGHVTDIVASINELQNLKVIDLGSNLSPDQATSQIIAYVRDNNIKYAVLFKYIDPDNSSTFGVCISRMGTTGWLIYLIARKGLERLQFNSRGSREAWNEYGGILRHQQNAIGDGQLETMSVNGLKSLIVDNLTANESLSSTRKILSILSANQGRILNEKIKNKADNTEFQQVKQKQLQLSVKDNGNIVLSNLNGESQEFMPATPSGDPMHWAYVSAGAEYNDTDQTIKKTAFWGGEIDHLPKHYYLNGLGDITEEQMAFIYRLKDSMTTFIASGTIQGGRFWQNISDSRLRTLFGTNNIGRWVTDKTVASNVPFASTKIEVIKWTNTDKLAHIDGDNLAMKTNSEILFLNNNLKVIDRFMLNKDSDFYQAPNLEELRLWATDFNVNLSKNPKISKTSIIYTIENVLKSTSKALVIILHADVYARLVDDTEIKTALETKNAALEGTGGSISLVSA